ncbi:MAG: hypothetical protein ACI9ES_000106 [Oceanospirillaceae bacterium]|jgi:hypothetical protein
MKSIFVQLSALNKLPLLLVTILLSACSVSSQLLNNEPFNFYLLNSHTGSYCQGYENQELKGPCRSLTKTISHHQEVKVIENIYQQKITDPNRIGSLMGILLEGEHLTYQVTALEQEGVLQLPINQQTDTVWRVLVEMDSLSEHKNWN